MDKTQEGNRNQRLFSFGRGGNNAGRFRELIVADRSAKDERKRETICLASNRA